MVVGILRSFEKGKSYSYEDIRERFHMSDKDAGAIVDYLMEKGCLKPRAFEVGATSSRLGEHLCAPVYCVSDERSMRYEAV